MVGHAGVFLGVRTFSCEVSLVNNRFSVVRQNDQDRMQDGRQDGEKICADPPVDVLLEEKIPHPEHNELSKLNEFALLRMARVL
ncbi:hypothetical protein pipiens_009986 [Culex pipiens pipiens]|uniref:Uncharacterized protein n=1 Tax=Culex pipiens pipiens TaxID=38569 RepID=A0ABD1DBW0_CULPP